MGWKYLSRPIKLGLGWPGHDLTLAGFYSHHGPAGLHPREEVRPGLLGEVLK